MISAKEARRIVEELGSEKAQAQWEHLTLKIEAAVKMGRLEVYYTDKAIEEVNKMRLKELGYTVYSDGRDGHASYNISW